MDDAKPHIKTREILTLLLVLFSRELGLNLILIWLTYPCLEEIKVAGCKEPITEDIWKVLKKVGMDKPPGTNEIPYKVHLRLFIFVLLLAIIYINWMRQESSLQ